MKAIVKTWRNRLPLVSDALSHWNDIFTWRQHHYELIVQHYEAQTHDSQQVEKKGGLLIVTFYSCKVLTNFTLETDSNYRNLEFSCFYRHSIRC